MRKGLISSYLAWSLFLMTSTFPGMQCLAQPAFNKVIQLNDSLYASEVLLFHKGIEVLYWKDPTCPATTLGTASMVKSWTGLAIGTLVDRGLIGSVDEKVCQWLPEWKDGCIKGVTVRHLLTMTAGFNRRGGTAGILAQDDNNAYVLNTRMDTVPDIRFGYSNESVQLLGIILERVSGMDANSYLRKYLFEPLDMVDTRLGKDPSGKNWVTYGGCTSSVRDAAKIRSLILGRGRYNGRQVVSEKWIEASLEPGSLAPYYGYLWWVDRRGKYITFAAMGDPGVLLIIYPQLELVFVRNQACENNVAKEPRYSSAFWFGPGFINAIGDEAAAN
jgi:CubicO group peptidase (beta-lactamase class C family)